MNEQLYRQLLRLYPVDFRKQFGEPMLQHFHDQHRDAQKSNRPFAMVRFTASMLFDTFLAAACERFSKSPAQTSTTVAMKKIPSFRFLFVAFLLPLMAGVILTTWQQPRTFMAMSRFLLTKNSQSQTYDPYFIQSQVEILLSQSVLQDVAADLGLAKTMAQRFGIKTKFESLNVPPLLRNQIQISQARNTSLIELRVYSESPREAAAIANKIPEVYARQNSHSLAMVDSAQPSLRPVRPNVPLNIMAGLLISSILALIATVLLRALLLRRSPPVAVQ